MKVIIIFLILFICWKIIKSSGTTRFLWLLGGVLFIPSVARIISTFNGHFMFIISYILSLYSHKELKKEIDEYPLKYASIFILIVCIMIGLLDNRIAFISKFSRGIIEFGTTYLCLFVGYTAIKRQSDLTHIIKGLVSMLFVVTIYGLITAVLKNNPFYDMVMQSLSDGPGIWSNIQERGYRVCSFMDNPIVYGSVMGFFTLFIYLYWSPQKNLSKYILLGLLLMNVLVANSRTGLASTVVLFMVFYFLRYGITLRIIKYIFGALLICAVLYNIPFFHGIIDSGIDLITTGGENTQGSNMSLKEGQLEASLYYFYKAPYFGNGFAYFDEVLGNKDSSNYDPELFGLEGYGYKLLVEEGLFMMIAVAMFFLRLFIICLRQRKSFPSSSSFLAAATLSFLFFIFATGTYGDVFVFYFLILGLIFKYIQSYDVLHSHTSLQRT